MKEQHGWFLRVAATVERAMDGAAAAVLATLVLIVLWGVFTRFVMGAASWWTEEASRLLLIWLAMLGTASASARSEHLGVDYFVNQLHPDPRRLVALAAEWVVIAFAAAVLVYGGAALVVDTLNANQTTAALEIKMGYVYSASPIAGLAMILFSIRRLVALWRSEPLESSKPAAARAQRD